MLIVDTREKPRAITKILKYFDDNHIEYVRKKLDYGDYMDHKHPELSIDRKQNIQELSMNCTRDHARFRRELERTKAAGARLIILVEQNRYKDRDEWIHVRHIEDLMRWSSPYTQVRGEKVYRVLASWCAKYPVRVEFCDKQSTGKRIYEIIYEENER